MRTYLDYWPVVTVTDIIAIGITEDHQKSMITTLTTMDSERIVEVLWVSMSDTVTLQYGMKEDDGVYIVISL